MCPRRKKSDRLPRPSFGGPSDPVPRSATFGKAPAKLLPAAALFALLAGCANPGPPRPPTLYLPEAAKGLSAERVGDRVVLSWQTSPDTTDGQLLKGPIAARICRDDSPQPPPAEPIFPAPPNPCRVVHELRVKPSTAAAPTQVTDDLPPPLAAGEPRLMAYRVTLLNEKGRSAGPSAPVYAIAGAAPPAVGPIAVTPRRNGALIRWTPSSERPGAPMLVTRTLVANAAGPVAPKHSGRRGSQPAAPMKASAASTLQQATLTAEGGLQGDPGGMVDHGIHDGDTLRYGAQRVLTVQLTPPPALVTGKKGRVNETKPVAQSFELKSEPSPVVTFAFHDAIPPAAPAGLAAVTGGGFGEAPSIDLSWEPNSELDIVGYNVYRAALDSHFVRLNSDFVMGPEFRDATVEPGRTYAYRVTAVDRHGNESAPSATVKAQVRRPES